MYYDEKVINGVLCHKDTPDGEWIPFSPESMTLAYCAMKMRFEEEKAAHEHATALLEKLAAELHSAKP